MDKTVGYNMNMFDIYHELTEEEAVLVQEYRDAKNELKSLIDARYIYQKDMEMIEVDYACGPWGVIILGFFSVFFWLFFIGDIIIGLVFQMFSISFAIAFASGAPVFAIVLTVFFFKELKKYLLVYSKSERYMKLAEKENVKNLEAYKRDIGRKYCEVNDRLKEAQARVDVLENELKKMEKKSSSDE